MWYERHSYDRFKGQVGLNLTFDIIFVCLEPDAAPENVSAVSTTFSSINVSWEPVPKAEQNGIITEYEVNVSKVSGGLESQTNIFTKNLSAVIQNLTMLVMYRIEVRAHTRKGPGEYSPPKKLMTLETGNAFRK